MKVERLDAFLRRCSCFAVLADNELNILREKATIKNFELGERVFRQGDVGDAMFLVYNGKVRVIKEENGREIPLNTLYAGEHFGELALISRQPRNASIRAAADSALVSIPADAVAKVLEQNGELRKYFEQYAERIELWNFIKQAGRLGTELKPPQLRQLVDQFEEAVFEPDQEIIRQGETPRNFYLIQRGRVRVLRDDRLQATLTGGDTFGGGQLVHDPPGTCPFTLKADGVVHTLALSAESFRNLLEEAPALSRFFEEQLAHYQADDAAAHFATLTWSGDGPPPGSVVAPGDARKSMDSLSSITAAMIAEAAAQAEQPPSREAPAVADAAAVLGTTELAEPPVAERPPAAPVTFWRRYLFPFIPQHEPVDCGAASLAMITAYHGRPVGVTRLRDLAGVTTVGASLSQLKSAAEEVGYEARALQVSHERLDRLRLPAVLFWRGYHYVVLFGLSPEQADVADPAFGKLRMSRKELETLYSGYALDVQPTEAAREVRTRPRAARRLLSLLSGQKGALAVIIAVSLLLRLCSLGPAYLTPRIVDAVLPTRNIPLLNLVILGMLSLSATQIAMSIFRARAGIRLSQRLDRALLTQFYSHLLQLPTRFFKLRRTGDIVARFSDNANVRQLFTAGTINVFLDALMVVVYFALLFSWNVKLALVVLAFVPLYVGLTLVGSPVMKRQYRRLMEDGAAHSSNLIESVGQIDMVKAMSIEAFVQKRWEQLFQRYLKSQLSSQKVEQIFGAIGSALQVLSTVVLLWYGAVLVLRNQLSVGQYMAFNMVAGMVIGPLQSVIGLWDQLQLARVSLERLSDVLDNDPEPQPPPDERVYVETIRGHVRFENVFFHYGAKGAPHVLRGVSFEAKPGQRIAIVGRSGSGKTTIARLLLALYRPTEGHITIDGWDLSRIDLESFRRQIGFVLQENMLFSGTICENIALGDGAPDMERVQEAAILAGAHEFIVSMPLRYNTVIGEFGLTLSGGQRQRVSIACALYRNPRILVLDEATSALDSLSEREIQKNMDAILADRTAFIIAHKIATVRDAHRILVVHDGGIIEQGTHDELIARHGAYYYLAAQQLNL